MYAPGAPKIWAAAIYGIPLSILAYEPKSLAQAFSKIWAQISVDLLVFPKTL